MIRIMVADDHRVFREGIVSILEHNEEIEVVAQANDGMEVLDKLPKTAPDLILMDI
ncbi:MAG: response regulator, partial [Phaeodactylibacter sp.]|nr:response regulator [Phaeodactylibacter sp.]